jgi:hypothetical protein
MLELVVIAPKGYVRAQRSAFFFVLKEGCPENKSSPPESIRPTL